MTMTIMSAARAAGVSAKAVRLWESKGLLPPARRTTAGYRVFTDADVAVLRCISQAKSLHLSLADIKEILKWHRSDAEMQTNLTELLNARIAEVNQTIAELHHLRRRLSVALAAADGAEVCDIIERAVSAPD